MSSWHVGGPFANDMLPFDPPPLQVHAVSLKCFNVEDGGGRKKPYASSEFKICIQKSICKVVGYTLKNILPWQIIKIKIQHKVSLGPFGPYSQSSTQLKQTVSGSLLPARMMF